MRLLPIGPDHVGHSTAECDTDARRWRYRRSHGRQHMPLRHLCAHPGGDQEGKRCELMGNTRSKGGVGLSRRAVLAGGAGALLLGFRIPQAAASAGELAPNALIRIGSDDKITLIMPQVEMGQGTYTSISMIMAEELDADFAEVVVEHAPPDEKLYVNPMFGVQVTGNSNSIRAFWKPLREAGATTRAMLVGAAAQQWGVDAASCTTANSVVTHA